MTVETCFRHAAWDTPWWANPNRNAGRYNRAGDAPTQYWCLHPQGPTAELLRALGKEAAEDIDAIRLRLWAARIDVSELPDIRFDNAPDFDVSAEELVSDDHSATQDLADRLRDQGVDGFLAPSAALPGTRLVVLLGPRLLFPYLAEPIDPDQQIPTAHAAEDAAAAAEVLPFTGWPGDAHAGLEAWRRTGVIPLWEDPPIPP